MSGTISDKECKIEISQGCCEIVIINKEQSQTDSNPAKKIFNLMVRALNGGFNKEFGALKTEEIAELCRFLEKSKIEIKTNKP